MKYHIGLLVKFIEIAREIHRASECARQAL